MADVRQRLVASIESVIEASRAGKRELPENFRQLVTSYYPAFDRLFQAQYDVLVEQGDKAERLEDKAGFYLDAVSLKPASSPARDKLVALARRMEASGRPETVALLKKAAAAAPDDPRFSELLETARAARDARAEIFTDLYEIKLVEPFSAKIEPYRSVFLQLEDAVFRYGEQRMADPLAEVEEQVRADIAALREENRLIPEPFLEFAPVYIPGLEKFLHEVQYDILIAKAEAAESLAAAADYYLSALEINPYRPEASKAIRDLALTAEAGGDYRLAGRVLDEARDAAPANGMIAEIHDAISREIRIYPTSAGCDAETGLEEAPVTTETLTICLEYRNLAPDTIVQVALAGPNGEALELPVVLKGRSGSKSVDVAAPVEGFAVGSYHITARQDRAEMAQSRIRFIPQRR
jgi:hypothetical protein